MALWLLYLFFALILPGTMLFFGQLWKKHPPQNINSGYGYRTARSMKSPEAWDFAQACCGRVWRLWGGIALGVTAAAFVAGSFAIGGGRFPDMAAEENVDAVGYLLLALTAVQLVVLVGSIIPVERALKRNFG